jgi:hypothetical protein
MSIDSLELLPLTKWFLSNYDQWHATAFPGGGKVNYADVLRATHHHLVENVHPNVQQRAELVDKDMYLTDHGPKHIEMVMRRAATLIRTKSPSGTGDYAPCLTPYEVFLLVLGIHFHDVGNMYGRDQHEQRILAVMDRADPLKLIPWFERKEIAKIALCHGGTIHGDKNTIGTLLAPEQNFGEVTYRPQLIAAVLRLADELADESSRADTFGLQKPEELPPTCLIFHKYAAALHSVAIKSGEISLSFNLHVDDATQTFEKSTKGGTIQHVYLLDEIYERSLKTYTEMVYCSRFMRQLDLQLYSVRVSIQVFKDKSNVLPVRTIDYVIGDSGYPAHAPVQETLRQIAHGFNTTINGKQLAEELLKT